MSTELEHLSPVTQDFLKAIWSAEEWGGGPITTKALAERFGTSSASVTDTVKRLAAADLVAYTPYKPVRLTDVGRRHAVQMVRRHRLLETYLVSMLNYSWTEVHDEAERLEHAVSDLFVSRIDALMGFPTADPHGDPIPDAHGRIYHPDRAVLLGEATAEGLHRVDRVDDSENDILTQAADHGCVPGAHIVPSAVLENAPNLAEAVWVSPVQEG